MEVVGGSFGSGQLLIRGTELVIDSSSVLAGSTRIPLSDIASIDRLSAKDSKKLGEAVSLAGAGMLVGSALGPLGGLAGLVIGSMAGGHKTHIIFSIRCHDGSVCVARASAVDFATLEAAILAANGASASPNHHTVEMREASVVSDDDRRLIDGLGMRAGADTPVEAQNTDVAIRRRLAEVDELYAECLINDVERENLYAKIRSER